MNREDKSRPDQEALTAENVDITEQLSQRFSRPPNHELENQALKRLSRALLVERSEFLKEITDTILGVCDADSAGISLIEKGGFNEVFRWSSVSGRLGKFVNETLPRESSPCGIVIDREATLLLERPSRLWTYIDKLGLPVHEVLLTPFYRKGRPIGTLWAVSHRTEKKFDLEDKRLLESLADMAALAVEEQSRWSRLSAEHEKMESELDHVQFESLAARAERDSSREQQRWLQQAIDHIPKPIFFLNLETQKMWFTNAAAQRMLGFRYENEMETAVLNGRIIVHRPNGELVAPHNLPSRRALRGETITGEEFILTTLVGRFHLNIFAAQIPASFGRPRTAVILFQDITKLKAAEKELKRIQSDLNEAVEVAQIGFWSLDINTNKVVVTPLFMQQLGMDASAFDGNLETALERVDPEDRDFVRQAIATSIRDDSPYNVEYRVNQPDGSVRWIEAKGAMIFDEAGAPVRFAGTTIDITKAVKARKEIEAAKMAAELANQTKSQFLANMSHEIRTPLGAIMGFSDLAREPDATKEEIESYLGTIDRNSKQVLRIIDDILDLAKVEAGRVELESVDFSLTEFIADFSSLMGFRARENGIGFNIEVETDLPSSIRTDPTKLRQILYNAVGNAIKFTSRGTITLSVRFEDELLEFGIEDTGRGISEEQARGLFQAFVQADASTTRLFGGTGLGLVLTKKFCQLLGGDYVLVESELGKGSTFKASLKVKLPSGARIIPREKVVFENLPNSFQSSKRGLLESAKVLLVEDSPDNQVLIRLILERQGVELEVASDGLAGIEKALAGGHDLILMDIQMPHMDGHEAVQTLRAKGYEKPIIALTAHAMKEEAERARRSGFTDFLSKPIQREALIQMVSDYARKAR